MFHLTSQQQTKRLRTIYSTALTFDGILYTTSSIIGWIAYKNVLENEIQNGGMRPLQEIVLTCASIGTVGMITLPIVIYRSWFKTVTNGSTSRNRGTPLTRLWSLPGWICSLASLVVIIGVAYHSQHQCNQAQLLNINPIGDSTCTDLFASSLIRASIACTLVSTILTFILMTWSIINPSSVRSTVSLDPHLQVDWYYQRNTNNKEAKQTPNGHKGFLKRFLLSPQEINVKRNSRPKYQANIFSEVNYGSQDNINNQQSALTAYELHNYSPFDQRSLHRTQSHESTIAQPNLIRHQSSFSSHHSHQIKRKQIKESDYPLNDVVVTSLPNDQSVFVDDDAQYFDARSIQFGKQSTSPSTSLHSLSPSSSTYNLTTPKDSPILEEAIIVQDNSTKSLSLPMQSAFAECKPTTWIVPTPTPAFSPRVFPRKTSLLHNRDEKM